MSEPTNRGELVFADSTTIYRTGLIIWISFIIILSVLCILFLLLLIIAPSKMYINSSSGFIWLISVIFIPILWIVGVIVGIFSIRSIGHRPLLIYENGLVLPFKGDIFISFDDIKSTEFSEDNRGFKIFSITTKNNETYELRGRGKVRGKGLLYCSDLNLISRKIKNQIKKYNSSN